MPEGDAVPPPLPLQRETGIQQVMTSTSVGKHPTAFTATGLPILRIALNPEEMTARLAPLLAQVGGPGGEPRVTYAKLLAYKQGNRGAVQYLVARDGGPPMAVLGKLYPQASQAVRVDAILSALWGAVFGGSPLLGVPRPLGCVPELSMMIYLPVDGRPLDEVLLGDEAGAAIELTAAWLATLHRATLPLDRRFHAASELVNLTAWATLIAQSQPEQAEPAAHLAELLQRDAVRLRADVIVPIHKDFHYKHVLVDRGVRVIDFDEVRLGDPMHDVAHFCAHLRLLACRTRDAPPGRFAALERAFLDAYQRRGGAPLDERFPWFAASTCLKIAKQLCTVRGVRPRPDGEERGRQLAIMLAEGLAFGVGG